MEKRFNTTGTCYPHIHYMMDNREKLAKTMNMVKRGEYFIINRPRQYGKTTTLFCIEREIKNMPEYMALRISFEDVDDAWNASDPDFARMFLKRMHKAAALANPALKPQMQAMQADINSMSDLSDAITETVHATGKKLVLLIDEVDASANYMPFLKFLAMLRLKYLDRFSPDNATFHSIVLAGVHDIKSLKNKYRDGEASQYNSPWNISVDFEVEMAFSPAEIAPMLEEYSEAEGVAMDIPAIAERLYFHTSGYPFLVSRLCQIIAEKLLPAKAEKSWALEDVEEAVRMLLRENNTNFESLIKNLENNRDLYDLAYEIIIHAEEILYDPHEPLSARGRLHGIFKANGRLKIHNRIYEQILYNYMTAKTAIEQSKTRPPAGSDLSTPDGGLDLPLVLQKFRRFMKEEYSEKDAAFLERNGRLIFLAFLNPILNGRGHAFKEVQISEERRLDVAITYGKFRYTIELKRWMGEKAHQNGLLQLADYLDRQGQDYGYLLIFDPKKQQQKEEDWLECAGKKVFAVWV